MVFEVVVRWKNPVRRVCLIVVVSCVTRRGRPNTTDRCSRTFVIPLLLVNYDVMLTLQYWCFGASGSDLEAKGLFWITFWQKCRGRMEKSASELTHYHPSPALLPRTYQKCVTKNGNRLRKNLEGHDIHVHTFTYRTRWPWFSVHSDS